MGLIFDLAIAALALVVVGSLALLAWTLGATAVDAVRRETASVVEARASVAATEARIRQASADVARVLDRLARLTARGTDPATVAGDAHDRSEAGERPNA